MKVTDVQMESKTPALHDLTCYIHHLLYQCPVYVWVSRAHYRSKSKQDILSQACFIVYMEYRGSDRASRYSQKTYTSLDEVEFFISNDAAKVSLPDICPVMTEKYLIGCVAEKA